MDLDPNSHDEFPVAPGGELKKLLCKGGRRGRMDYTHSDWNYFPSRKKRTNSMISMSELKNDIEQIKEFQTKLDDTESFDSSHLLLHVNQVKAVMNYNCKTCKKRKETSSVSEKK